MSKKNIKLNVQNKIKELLKRQHITESSRLSVVDNILEGLKEEEDDEEEEEEEKEDVIDVSYFRKLLKPSSNVIIKDIERFETKTENPEIISLLEALKEKNKLLEGVHRFENEISLSTNVLELREKLKTYETMPYKNAEKFESYKKKMSDLENLLLKSEDGKTIHKRIVDIFEGKSKSHEPLKAQLDNCERMIKTRLLEEKEKHFLLEFLKQTEQSVRSRDTKLEEDIKYILKKTNKTEEDYQILKELLSKYSRSNIVLLCEAQTVIVIFETQVLPTIKLNRIDSFLKSKSRFHNDDVETLKTMLADIPIQTMGPNRAKYEMFQMIYTYLRTEIDAETQFNLEEELEEEVISKSNSDSDKHPISMLRRNGVKTRDLLLQQTTESIPIILIAVHGAISYQNDECSSFQSPFDVLFRLISSAPGELSISNIVNPEYQNLLDNKVILNPNSTVDDCLNEKKQNTKLDNKIKKFQMTVNNKLGTNINFKNRNHLVINYKNTKLCTKILEKHIAPSSGIYILNNTKFLKHGTNLMINERFIDYLQSKKTYLKLETKTSIERFLLNDLYNYLIHLGYKQVAIIDMSCENNFFASGGWPKFSQETENSIAKIQAYLNIDEHAANMLFTLVEKDIYRKDAVYRKHKSETIRLGRKALQKSKRHKATMAKNKRGLR